MITAKIERSYRTIGGKLAFVYILTGNLHSLRIYKAFQESKGLSVRYILKDNAPALTFISGIFTMEETPIKYDRYMLKVNDKDYPSPMYAMLAVPDDHDNMKAMEDVGFDPRKHP